MKISLRHLWIFLGLFGIAESATIAVSPSEAPTFGLDIDGDGIFEIESIFLHPGGTSGFLMTVDGVSEPTIFPTELFVGTAVSAGPNFRFFVESGFSSAEFMAPSFFNRSLNNIIGVGTVTPELPVRAMWSYGTSGNGSDPIHLLGTVIDFREYYLSGGIDDVIIHYHDYGIFSPGESSGTISLTTTGIPEPSHTIYLCLASFGLLLRSRR